MFQKLLTFLSFLALLHPILPSNATGIASASFVCTTTTLPIPIKTNSTIFKLPSGIPKNNSEVAGFTSTIFSVNAQAFGEEVFGGERELNTTFDIFTQLCTPKGGLKNGGTLIFGIHGIGFDHTYWNFDSPSSQFNFVNAATKQGHAVFLFDRLGTGKSSHPDGTQEVQAGVQVEIAHQLVQKIRSGSTGLKFGKLVGLGHSFGSIQTAALTLLHPQDFDHVILTGFTLSSASTSLAFAGLNIKIAATINPPVFGKLLGDYLITSDQFANEFAFFKFGGFDPRISALAFAQGQTATIGELLTISTVLTTPAEEFKGKVLSIVGENDLYVVSLGLLPGLSPGPFSSIYHIEHAITSTLLLLHHRGV